MKKIDVIGIGRRLLAAIMDMALFGFLFVIIAGFLMPLFMDPLFSYGENMVSAYQYQTASHLYVLRTYNYDSKEEKIVEVKDYTEELKGNIDTTISSLLTLDKDSDYFIEHLKYYYTSYKTGENIELPNDTETKHYNMIIDRFVAPNFLEEITIEGVTYLPRDYYTIEWFNESILEFGKESQVFTLDEENHYIFTEAFKAKYRDESKTDIENEIVFKSKAVEYLKYKVNDAQKDLYFTPFYREVNNNVYKAQIFQFLTSFFVSILLIYMLFPLLFKNGETLGKFTLKIALVNKNGYQVTKLQVVIRELFFILELSLSAFIVGVSLLTSIATMGLGIFLLFIFTLIHKEKRSLHDLVAGTIAIDKRTSVFFKDATEEEKYVKKVDDSLEKIKSTEIENPHLIQVGGEIVDPKIKEEIEKEDKE